MTEQVTAISVESTETWVTSDPAMVTGSVVISMDYWKRFLSSFRMLFGGEVRAYRSLMERARREAVLRMQENAQAMGRNAVVNVRLESTKVASALSGGKGTTGVEVLAYGTAVRAQEVAALLEHVSQRPVPWANEPAREPVPVRRVPSQAEDPEPGSGL